MVAPPLSPCCPAQHLAAAPQLPPLSLQAPLTLSLSLGQALTLVLTVGLTLALTMGLTACC